MKKFSTKDNFFKHFRNIACQEKDFKVVGKNNFPTQNFMYNQTIKTDMNE
jgi:hypothetical protein